MNQGFWKKLSAQGGSASGRKKPIFALAPLANVTDAAFRQIIAKYGKPDIMWTEFVSADGLFMGLDRSETDGQGGREALMQDLSYSEKERPIVAQFFTANPENMKKAAELAKKLKFDGVDINMGCPDRSVEKQGAGAALMKNPKLARKLIRAAKEGAGDLPVSVKTRIGYKVNEIETWLPELLAEEPAAVIIHARTRKEMSGVPAHWDVIKRAVLIRDSLKSNTLILGNGDSLNISDAKEKAKETGADGVMLGRAIFGNPWLFDTRKKKVSKEEKLKVMVENTLLFEKIFKNKKNFAVMKKHLKAYVSGWEGAKELRIRLMEAKNAKEVKNITFSYLKTKPV